MSIADLSADQPGESQTRKPRIAIMGEFSAGKSTLSNLLIGSDPLPVKVTATQLPPVWISHGDLAPHREDLEGNISPVDLTKLDEVPLDQTKFIRIFLDSDILELCDLIDMPGISDPNMSSEVWERAIDQADSVLWCTHATQAWRQSEAAVWKTMPPELYDKSFLLLTRMDKILTEDDQQRVIKRVRRETQGMFAELFPISLTAAVAAQDDRGKWESSGAEALAQSLVDLLHRLAESLGHTDSLPRVRSEDVAESDTKHKVFHLDDVIKEKSTIPEKIVPVRVKIASTSAGSIERPTRGERPASWVDPVTSTGQNVPQDQSTPLLRRQDPS